MASACSRVPIAFRTLAYCEGIHYGAERDWDFVLGLFRRETVQVEKERLLLALACSRDTHTLKRYWSCSVPTQSGSYQTLDSDQVPRNKLTRIEPMIRVLCHSDQVPNARN